MTNGPQIVFDTDCVLCSGLVHFILRNERDGDLRFVSAWGETGLRLAAAHSLTRDDLDETFLVISDGRAFIKSDAAFFVAGHLRAPLSWLRIFRFTPRLIRDGIYTFVARRRIRWFGRRQHCFRPPAGAEDRFIEA